ncbi:MAG: hypothetical protein IJ416_03000 [Ruminiclostridium sp.]|nr:hypothetical protein [Ruminiclostridium sp.]
MLISDIIRNCTFELVNQKILLHYGEKEIEDYRKLFLLLKEKSALPQTKGDLTIFIETSIETDDDSIYVSDFDENDPTLHFDVCGHREGEDIVYSITSSGYDEFLTYAVDEETLAKFSSENILAHCLYEITTYGFEK